MPSSAVESANPIPSAPFGTRVRLASDDLADDLSVSPPPRRTGTAPLTHDALHAALAPHLRSLESAMALRLASLEGQINAAARRVENRVAEKVEQTALQEREEMRRAVAEAVEESAIPLGDMLLGQLVGMPAGAGGMQGGSETGEGIVTSDGEESITEEDVPEAVLLEKGFHRSGVGVGGLGKRSISKVESILAGRVRAEERVESVVQGRENAMKEKAESSSTADSSVLPTLLMLCSLGLPLGVAASLVKRERERERERAEAGGKAGTAPPG